MSYRIREYYVPMEPPPMPHRVYCQKKGGKPEAFDVECATHKEAIEEVRRQGYERALVVCQ